MKKTITLLVLILICSLSVNSQKTVITGFVKDSLKRPIVDVTIFVDNIKQKGKTNLDGSYKLKLKKAPSSIMFLSSQFGIEEINYTGENNINIIYGKEALNVNSHDSMIAVKTVTTTKKKSTIEYSNIYDYLRGRVAGLQVTSDNRILIRGTISLKGELEPLFVLNEVPVQKPSIESISPSDIKSIAVLKGPETAFYGSRGANGVILITTY